MPENDNTGAQEFSINPEPGATVVDKEPTGVKIDADMFVGEQTEDNPDTNQEEGELDVRNEALVTDQPDVDPRERQVCNLTYLRGSKAQNEDITSWAESLEGRYNWAFTAAGDILKGVDTNTLAGSDSSQVEVYFLGSLAKTSDITPEAKNAAAIIMENVQRDLGRWTGPRCSPGTPDDVVWFWYHDLYSQHTPDLPIQD